MKIISLAALVLSASSCNLNQPYTPVTIKELLPVGSILHLTQALDIPAGRSFIYIANGKVMPLKNYNTVDNYQPYCMFHLYKEVEQPHVVMPDLFEVTKIVDWDAYYGELNTKKFTHTLRNKENVIKAGHISYEDAGPSIVMYATVLRLHSAKQPDVKELVCGHWDVQGIIEPLTLSEMKKALYNLIVIEGDTRKSI